MAWSAHRQSHPCWLRVALAPERSGRPPAGPADNAGQAPPFIVSLLPEGWLELVLSDRDERAMLRSGKRYMSNITIVKSRQNSPRYPPISC